MLSNFKDTIKIKHTLNHEQQQLKAEFFGNATPPLQKKEKRVETEQSNAPLVNALILEEIRQLRESAKPDASQKIVTAQLQNGQGFDREMIEQQKEIMRENQAILRQILEVHQLQRAQPQVSSLAEPTKVQTKEEKKQEMTTNFMEALKPLIEDLKAVKDELQALKSNEVALEKQPVPSSASLHHLAQQKQTLHNKMRDMHKKITRINSEIGTSDQATQQSEAQKDFIDKLSKKVLQLEESLNRDKEVLAEKAKLLSHKQQVNKKIEEVEKKIDFLGNKAKIEERLGNDFSYKEYIESLSDLLADLNREKHRYYESKTQYEIPIANLKISSKELSSIAKRAKPEMSVLELKKAQFGSKFSAFVSSQYQRVTSGQNILFKKLNGMTANENTQQNDDKRIVSIKPDYLKEIPTQAKQAEKDIQFLKLGQNPTSILIDHNRDLQRLKNKIKQLEEPLDGGVFRPFQKAVEVELPPDVVKVSNQQPKKIELEANDGLVQETEFKLEEINHSFLRSNPRDQKAQVNHMSQITVNRQLASSSPNQLTINESEAEINTRVTFGEVKEISKRNQSHNISKETFKAESWVKEAGVMAFAEELFAVNQHMAREQKRKSISPKLTKIAEQVVEKQLKWISKKEQEIKDYESKRAAFKKSKERIFKKIGSKASHSRSKEKQNKQATSISTIGDKNINTLNQDSSIRENQGNFPSKIIGSKPTEPSIIKTGDSAPVFSSEELLNDARAELEARGTAGSRPTPQDYRALFAVPEQTSHTESLIEDYYKQLDDTVTIKEQSLELSDFSLRENYQPVILTSEDLTELKPKQTSVTDTSKQNYKFVFKPKK